MARNLSRSLLAVSISLGLGALVGAVGAVQAKEIRFNTDILDSKDRENIDLSVFNQKGFILPGTYELAIKLNGVTMPARSVSFMAPEDDPKGSEACLTPELVELIGLTASAQKNLTWWNGEQCLALHLGSLIVVINLLLDRHLFRRHGVGDRAAKCIAKRIHSHLLYRHPAPSGHRCRRPRRKPAHHPAQPARVHPAPDPRAGAGTP